MESTYTDYHRKYYESKKAEINERRREYAKIHQQEYREKLRKENPPRPRGRPKKVV
jgi:hypothetical protein